MDILSWINSLPKNPGSTRDKIILDAVYNGLVTYKWIPITSSVNDDTAIFYVCDDAVRVEDNNMRFRFPVSAELSQKCADLMDGSLITSKISDLAYRQSQIIVNATTLPPGKDMATINKSEQWNTLVESKRGGKEGLFRDCGKAWILSNRITNNNAVNYGFYHNYAPYTGPGKLKMWQTIGTRHNRTHTDYSQTLILMRGICEVNGQSTSITDIMRDKKLSSLLSYEGPLRFTRYPGVPS